MRSTKNTTITVSPKAPTDSTKVVMIDFNPAIFFTVLKGLRILKALKAEIPEDAPPPPGLTFSKNYFTTNYP